VFVCEERGREDEEGALKPPHLTNPHKHTHAHTQAQAYRALDEYTFAAADIKNALIQCNIQIDYLDNVYNAREWVGVGVGGGVRRNNSGVTLTSDTNTDLALAQADYSITEADPAYLLHCKSLLLAERAGMCFLTQPCVLHSCPYFL